MKEDNADTGTREKILKITVEMIKSGGLNDLTVRQIAKAADVNVGAVNYYFSSKENLLHIAIKEVLQSIKENISLLDQSELSPTQRLRQFLTAFTINHSVYRDCLRWMVSKNDSTFHNDYEFSSYLKGLGFEKVKAIIADITGETDSQILRMLSVQLMCAAVGPNIVIPSVCHAELPDVQKQIDILLTHFFNRN